MENYIITFIAAGASFVAAYLGGFFGLKNSKREKFFEERKNIYYKLVSILPVVGNFKTQSDFDYGSRGNCNAEDQISNMNVKLECAEEELERIKKNNEKNSRASEAETEVRNLKFLINKQKEYLKNINQLNEKLKKFESEGNKNLLRLFASPEVLKGYNNFKVALNNEYNCSGISTTEDIVYHINNIIFFMRRDLKS